MHILRKSSNIKTYISTQKGDIMLEVKHIKKSYKTGDFVQHALKDVSLEFRKSEFVAILGPSGSGKTTLLNIIGGLDRYDKGDLIINGKSTKNFKDKNWDSYRNNCIGFIFQSYNLISHISVLDNVEMGMTLSGVSQKERKKKAMEVLKKVGLSKHIHKKPNQLSGGQMQRVAIARALANDPDIILADEPTGALDSETSVQIMELIKEIAQDKLVIMVTHNPSLAEEYATRIVEMKDGELLNDSNPVTKETKSKEDFQIKKTSMNFLTALKLSFNNIKTKKGRTLLTAFASSIGIIGIALVLSLSNGFDIQIKKFEKDTLSSLPIMISEQAMNMSEESMNEMMGTGDDKEEYPTASVVYPQKPIEDVMTHKNNITKEYVEYIEKINPDLVSGVSYTRATSLNLIHYKDGKYEVITVDDLSFASIPKKLDNAEESGVVEENFDILKGTLAKNKEDLLILVDSKNRIPMKVLEALGIDSKKEEISFDEIIGKEIKMIFNNDFYKSMGGFYTINPDLESAYKAKDSITLKVVGIARAKEDNMLYENTSGLTYTEKLMDYVIEKNKDSDIVKAQEKLDRNILTGEQFTSGEEGEEVKNTILSYLGADTTPAVIQLFPKDFDAKTEILESLDKYNEQKSEDEQILYTDMADMISTLSGNIMDAITVVLIAFSAISLVVSSIMIGIITYISVLERTKEIGVLRSLGARKKDITRVFNAETFIIGITSGMIGILIARLLVIPTNIIIKNMTDLANVARMNPVHAILLILISVLLTLIGGAIPARIASKKDPVEALRTE